MLNGFGWPHLLIIAVLIIILFGAKRLPDAARGLGKSMRIFRAETQGMRQDEAAAGQGGAQQPAPPQQLSAPFAPPQNYAQQQPYVAPVADQVPAPQPQPQGDQQR
ncbi:MAG TPA: Sec-independent protein translocase subunit TatA [Pseudonocardiaceae bacterium]